MSEFKNLEPTILPEEYPAVDVGPNSPVEKWSCFAETDKAVYDLGNPQIVTIRIGMGGSGLYMAWRVLEPTRFGTLRRCLVYNEVGELVVSWDADLEFAPGFNDRDIFY